MAAKPTDWKTEKMPDETDVLSFQRSFSPEEFQRISLGFVPRAMEDKWFIYYSDGVLNFHRSWTGHHIYSISLKEQHDGGHQIVKAIVNRKMDQYNARDNAYDAALLGYIIDRLLLGKPVSFPVPSNIPEESAPIFRHSMVGYADPNVPPKMQEMPKNTNNPDNSVTGCLIGGAIGDAIGSFYEGRKDRTPVEWTISSGITDDTQLTLATCESIIQEGTVSPEGIAKKMLEWYNNSRLTGPGSSTLKALRDLQMGAHWGLSGRTGEYAAGNGAAMRIAPLAFFVDPEKDRTLIRDVCNITHKNDEAYVGALAVLYAIYYIYTKRWQPGQQLLDLIIPHLPDTGVRDNLQKLQQYPDAAINEAARLVGISGHVVQSVPFAIFAAQKIREKSFDDIIINVVRCGGDTDTNASIAGQIMGAYMGPAQFSMLARITFDKITEASYILKTGAELTRLIISIHPRPL